MKLTYTAQQRLKRIELIKEMVKKESDGFPRKKLIATIVLNFGNTKKKATEYVNMMVESEMIYEKEGVLWA